MVTLNNLLGTLWYGANFPGTWSLFVEERKLQVIKLHNNIKHTKLKMLKNISKTKLYTLKQVSLIESKEIIPTLIPRKLGDTNQCELEKLLLEESLQFISIYELELVSFYLYTIVASHYILLFDLIGADGICGVDW